MTKCAFLAAMLCFLVGCAPKNPLRVAPKQLGKLISGKEKFVLVFGSVRAVENGKDVTHLNGGAATVRFANERNQPPLMDLAIPNNQRFYMVLKAPPPKTYLDQFLIEVQWMDSAFDTVAFMRLKDQPAYALYLGEIQMTVAAGAGKRMERAQLISIKLQNELDAARSELKRLYPDFKGELIVNSALGSYSAPPPPRVK